MPNHSSWGGQQRCATTLEDVGVGGIMYWHNDFLPCIDEAKVEDGVLRPSRPLPFYIKTCLLQGMSNKIACQSIKLTPDEIRCRCTGEIRAIFVFELIIDSEKGAFQAMTCGISTAEARKTECFGQSFYLMIKGALQKTVGEIQRPLIDLSDKNFAKKFVEAFGQVLVPPFDPYKNSLNFMLASYVIPYNGLVGYVGTNPNLTGMRTKRIEILTITIYIYIYM
ncbi:hypothetical protein LguiB_021265 [Lonicera macranthoides]